ncbi:MAG: hypothetical protein AcusKO_14260 [Acuticoccus sp.]
MWTCASIAPFGSAKDGARGWRSGAMQSRIAAAGGWVSSMKALLGVVASYRPDDGAQFKPAFWAIGGARGGAASVRVRQCR